MCLHPHSVEPVPEETARVAKAAFPKGTTYMTMRDELGAIFEDEDFAHLFPRRGQPAMAPWRLALVTIMQFAEGLSDRQAADAVRARIDWKYALSLELADPGLDASVLSEFRSRLLEGGSERLLFDHLLERFRGMGKHHLTDVQTAPAPVADGDATPIIHEALKEKDLLPLTQFVDTGYLDAELLAESKKRYGVDLSLRTHPPGLSLAGSR